MTPLDAATKELFSAAYWVHQCRLGEHGSEWFKDHEEYERLFNALCNYDRLSRPKGDPMPVTAIDQQMLQRVQDIAASRPDAEFAKKVLRDKMGAVASFCRFQQHELAESGILDEQTLVAIQFYREVAKSFGETAGAL